MASLMPCDWSKQLVDLNIEKLTDKHLTWADMAFVGGMAVQRESAKQIILQCKAAGLTVVAGGPMFTAEPDEFPEVDHLVLDEAEITLREFLRDLADKKPKNIYRSNGFCDLHHSPVPAWELVKMKKYASMNIQLSRGCPFNCEFCNVTALFGHIPRLKTARQILSELNRIYNTGWRSSIFFVDDNFIGNKRFLKKELLPALIDWRKDKKGCVFFTEATINLADDDVLMEMMVAAGFDSVFIGIESPDEESLNECHKIQNKGRDLLESVRKIHRAGLQVMGGFIVGFDSDPQSIFQRQVEFIQNSRIVTAMVGMLQAPPGTRLFERLKSENRISSVFSGNNVDGTTNIIPKMGMDRLLEGYRSIMKQIYAPGNFYPRVRQFLREFKDPGVYTPLDFQRILAFFRSGFRLGFISRERFHYWYLILWTLIRKPKLLPLAVTLSIYGHHYRKICKLYIL